MDICITGRNGFIGSALSRKMGRLGFRVSSYPKPNTEIIFHFGSPSSDLIFQGSLDYAVKETINSFISLASHCKMYGSKLIYPSSATVAFGRTPYSRIKAALEEIQKAYNIKSLGLRIAAGYGPGEGSKGEYASVIYQWCKLMKNGNSPIVFGDGSQTRDFIYIDDIVDSIVDFMKDGATGVVDVGTGEETSFNEVIHLINSRLGTTIEPSYVAAPDYYVQNTPCKAAPCNFSLEEGIKIICQSL
jgi:UDP-glucose 4-epimerase